jgi:folate-binding protein YgfZ
MNERKFFVIPRLSVIDVQGNDAATIVHNLTTNEVRALELDEGRETFVTDVRGKTLGHVVVFRSEGSLRLIGPAGQSERIVEHLDRYTIREDATPTIRDQDFVGVILPAKLAVDLAQPLVQSPRLFHARIDLADFPVDLYGCGWLGEGTGLLLVEASNQEALIQDLGEQLSASGSDEPSFHWARTVARFPWYGIDLTEANLPQEADRDAVAISFTKGCYLGQETVARLDALGQVQKKLVAWSIEGGVPAVGTTLQADGKTVGRLTSVAAQAGDGALAIGPARRSHFDPGSTATTADDSGLGEQVARVV